MAIFGLMTRKEAQAAIVEAVKAALIENAPRWLAETAEGERYNLPDPSIYGNQADLYRKLSWVLQAVDNTAAAAALTRFSVYSMTTSEEPKDIPNHPFEVLLEKPNPLDSRYEFLYATVALWKLTGNAYWWLNRPDEASAPGEMWVLPSHMLIPVPDERMFIRGYLYYPGNGAEILLPPHEIMHFRRFNPFSRFVGLSAIESLASVALGDIKMAEWNTRLFAENNARLPGILTFEQMIADPTWSKIKDDTREASKKRELLMLRGVGAGGVKWMQAAVSQKEMEFLAGRRSNQKEIMDTLAPGLYTWLSGESTYSNANANRAAFNELTVYPMHVMMGEKITSELLPVYARNAPSPQRMLLGKFDDVRMDDRELKLKEQEMYAKTHSIEEIRKEHYGDKPLGDERDKLLPSQVNAQSGGIQEPPPNPFTDTDRNPNNDMVRQGEEERDEKTEKAVKAAARTAMIALRIPDAIRSELRRLYPFMDAEIRKELHITLAYLGDSRTLDRAAILRAINAFAVHQGPIKGMLQGLARFVSGEDTDPLVATFDSPQMPRVYTVLCDMLEANLVPYHKRHGFIPHMTLAYIPKDRKLPVSTIEPMEINFSEVYYVDGNEWIPVLLSGYANKSEAGTNDAALDELARYQRKALKKIGAAVEFVSDVIPDVTLDRIRRELPSCSDEAGVKAVFDRARAGLKPRAAPPNDALVLLEAIKIALEKA